MTALEKKRIRYRLFDRHEALVKGSPEDMQVACKLLAFLRKGEICLGLGDVDFRTECELKDAGVNIKYSGRGYTAYARIKWWDESEEYKVSHLHLALPSVLANNI